MELNVIFFKHPREISSVYCPISSTELETWPLYYTIKCLLETSLKGKCCSKAFCNGFDV